MIDFVQGVQGVVQRHVQGKSRAVISLCKVCKAFMRPPARENTNHSMHAHDTGARVMRPRTPAHLAHALSDAGFTHAHYPAHTLAHLEQRKK